MYCENASWNALQECPHLSPEFVYESAVVLSNQRVISFQDLKFSQGIPQKAGLV
jgi:hypothetical protein